MPDYDVFLSHASVDKPAVRELAARLKGDGLRVWLDEWVIQPGDSIPLAIEQGLESSRTLVLVMSQVAFDSEWVTLERHTALFRDPTNQQRRFIPLQLDDCDIKDSIMEVSLRRVTSFSLQSPTFAYGHQYEDATGFRRIPQP
ncbi:MAG: toll/interleukin-1 receptor domain-containing protein [Planctomycetes bacterium]|nr:toll/interleukin-1 receptor domain-containing protein [Planctomycetota bacterium]